MDLQLCISTMVEPYEGFSGSNKRYRQFDRARGCFNSLLFLSHLYVTQNALAYPTELFGFAFNTSTILTPFTSTSEHPTMHLTIQ